MNRSQTLTPTRAWALAEAKEIVFRFLPRDSADVYLFGSCASGRAASHSDIDIGIDARGDLPPRVLAEISEAMEESTIPYYVDVVDMRSVDSAFASRIRQQGLRWTI
jgi:predicted nucleotidyltransferase